MRHLSAGSQLLYRGIRSMPGSHGRVGKGGYLAEQEPTGGIGTTVKAEQRAGKQTSHMMQNWSLAGKGSVQGVGAQPVPM